VSAVAPKRELEVVPVNCRFYGKTVFSGRLVATGGNQCALIALTRTEPSPCQMEKNGNPIDESRCPLVRQAQEVRDAG
jgi:hypothetical protein